MARVYRTRRVLVPERLRKYTARWSRGGGGKYQQTDSDGSDGDGLPLQKAIGHRRVSFREGFRNIQQGRV